MSEVRTTREFDKWFIGLRSNQAYARIQTRIYRLADGLEGDVKPIRKGVSELRIDCGPGYRVYFTRQGATLIILLAGGSKKTQARDISLALKLAEKL